MAQQLPLALDDTTLLQTATTSLLQVDNYGLDSDLFEDQHQISFCLCVHCNSVCRNASELGCDHDYDQICLYCKDCLQLLIQDSDGKCPINAHLNPSIHSNRAIQRQIAQSLVICPYSSKYKMLKRTQNIDDDHRISDTIEGLILNEANSGCNWNGTLKELIDTHMLQCTKANNPLFVSQLRVKELCDKYINLEQKHQEVTQSLQTKVDQLQEALDSTKRVQNDQVNAEAQKQLMDKDKEIRDLKGNIHELMVQNKQHIEAEMLVKNEANAKKNMNKRQKYVSASKERDKLTKKYNSLVIQNEQLLKENSDYQKQHAKYTSVLKEKEKPKAKYKRLKQLILNLERAREEHLHLERIKRLNEDHSDIDNTRQRVYEIEERIINLEINRNRDRARNSKKMRKSKSSFLFNNKVNKRNSKSMVNVFDKRLVQPSRIFIKQGYLTKVSLKKDIRYLFVLFNDLLIYCSEGMSDRLILHQRIDITDEFFGIKIAVILDDKGHNRNTFEIHSIEKSFLCYAENNKEMEEWITAIEKCVDNILRSRMDVQVHAQDESRILETAPMFVPHDWSDECMMTQCHNKFNAMLRKKRNNCGYCGIIVCDTCCTNSLPHFDPKKSKVGVLVKVCLVCWKKYHDRVKPLINLEEMHRASKQINKAKQTTVVEEENSTEISTEEWEELYRQFGQYSEPEKPDKESSDDFAANFDNIVIPIVNENVMYLDSKHETVQQLTLFGFTEQNIKDAWALMKQHKTHVHIAPNHGPLFLETMLDYLNKLPKQKVKIAL